MKTMKKPDKYRGFGRTSLLRLAVDIATHPVFAGFTPTGQMSLATGHGGRIRRHRGLDQRLPEAPAAQPRFAGPAGEPGCQGCA